MVGLGSWLRLGLRLGASQSFIAHCRQRIPLYHLEVAGGQCGTKIYSVKSKETGRVFSERRQGRTKLRLTTVFLANMCHVNHDICYAMYV